MRRIALLFLLVAGSTLPLACARTPPGGNAGPDPLTPVVLVEPAAPPSSTPASAPSQTARATRTSDSSSVDPPLMPGGHACEPIVRCGVWSGCVWLDRIAPGRYRRVNGGSEDTTFVRRRECWPADAGVEGCAVHCTGTDAGPPCFDGLHPEEEECTGAAAPRPNFARCLLGDGICGSLI